MDDFTVPHIGLAGPTPSQIQLLRILVNRTTSRDQFIHLAEAAIADEIRIKLGINPSEAIAVAMHLQDLDYVHVNAGGEVVVNRVARRFVENLVAKEDADNLVKLLDGIHKQAKGRKRRKVNASDVGKDLGLSPEQIKGCVNQLADQNKITYPVNNLPPFTVSLSDKGKAEVDSKKPKPEPATGVKGWLIRVFGGTSEEIAKNVIKFGAVGVGSFLLGHFTHQSPPNASSTSTAPATQSTATKP